MNAIITTTHSMTAGLHSFAYALDFLREQVADVAPAEMVAQPSGITNHPMWVIGHLTYTCQLLGGGVGLSEWLPADWAKRFGTGSVPSAGRTCRQTHPHAVRCDDEQIIQEDEDD